MAPVPKSEKRLLLDCAAEGVRLLEAYFSRNPPGPFIGAPFFPQQRSDPWALEGRLYSANVDLFYTSLAAMLSTADRRQIEDLITRREIKGDLERTLQFTEASLYRESEFERALAESIARNTGRSDEELRQAFRSRFEIGRTDMLSLPRDRTVFFAKVNHGYWEYMRSSYDPDVAQPGQFREIDVANKVRRLRTSGATQFWGRQLQRLFTLDASHPLRAHARLCVSLTTGTEPVALSIRRELKPVTRGAAVGMLSLFETAAPAVERFSLADGGATRALIMDGTLERFFHTHVLDSEACLFLVPPHLKDVDVLGFDGAVYKFLVPPTRVNEAWKAFAATLLGYLTRLGRRHRSITVVAQAASVASLMALLFADLDPLPGVRLRYFDLGRVLDVAVPEFLQKQAWAAKNTQQYLAEGAKVFRRHPDAEAGFSLATMA